ncbi:hypothetical protein TWF481_000598 [Arthrobotrys musiformis]|uniref:C2H2-type domain-containing protein n=1 Tax=Arthrobotrys musiformis TaxID=47236 RepID=A0AAV9WN98_9PEZI
MPAMASKDHDDGSWDSAIPNFLDADLIGSPFLRYTHLGACQFLDIAASSSSPRSEYETNSFENSEFRSYFGIPAPQDNLCPIAENARIASLVSNTSEPPENTSDTPQFSHRKNRRNILKNYHCPECEMGFSSLRSLGDHLRNAHKMKGFKCDYCDKRVTRYDNLESHRRICSPPSNLSISPPKRKGPRDAVRSINLQPESLRPLPIPTSQNTETENASSVTPGRGGQPTRRISPQPQRTTLSNQGSHFDQSLDESARSAPSGLVGEVQGLKAELAIVKGQLKDAMLEASHWKKQYFMVCKE